jgi:hypothetical protein
MEMGLEKITVGEAVEWRLFDPGRYERNAGRIIAAIIHDVTRFLDVC